MGRTKSEHSFFFSANPSFWVLNQFSQVIRGVISENISYILLVQGKELIRWIDVKHGKTSIEVLSSVILSFGCYLNISEGWIVKTSYLVIVVHIFVQLCRKAYKFLAFNINLNGFKCHASLESFITYLTLSLITQFNSHSFWRKKLCLVQQLSRRATMNRMFYFRGELAQISLLDKLYLNILQQKILWVSLAIVCQKMKKNIDQ